MKTFLFSLVLIFAFMQFAQAQPVPDKDTAWTKDLSPETITGAKFTPDGSKIVVTTMEKIRVYDTESGEVLKYYDVSKITNSISCMDINYNGRYVVTGDLNNHVIIWYIDTGDTLKSIILESVAGITNIKCNPINDELLILYPNDLFGKNSILIKWNYFTGDTIKRAIPPHGKLCISKDSKYYITAAKELILWDYNNMSQLSYIGMHDNWVTDLDFSSDGRYIASAGHDGYVKIWDVENRNLYKSFLHDSGNNDVETVKFSPDSKFIVSGIRIWGNWNTKIWNFETKELIKIYPFGAIDYLDLDIGKKFVLASSGGHLRLLNAYWEPNVVIEEIPKDTVILYPNPSDNNVNISYENSIPDIISVKIYNTSGQIISTIQDGVVQPGHHLFKWNTSGQSSGIYFCKIIGNRSNLTYKIIIYK